MSVDYSNKLVRNMLDNKNNKRKSFIIYITGGYPDLKTTKRIILGLDSTRVDVIEIGIPFSDPIADGPVIQEAGYLALQKGTNLHKILALTRSLKGKTKAAIVLMGYYNSFLSYGISKFVKSCKNNGIDGIIVPDLVPEESGKLTKSAERAGLSTVFLVSPNSTKERIRSAALKSTGFLYCVSIKGVTGQRKKLPEIKDYIRKVRSITDLPLAVGFGIGNNAQAAHFLKVADGVIIGSEIIKNIKENQGKANLVNSVIDLVKSLKKGL